MFGLQQVVVVRADFRLVRLLAAGLLQPLCAVEFRGQDRIQKKINLLVRRFSSTQ